MSLKDRLHFLVERSKANGKRKTQAGVARACSISAPSVNGWFTGASKSIDGNYLTKAAAYFECSPHWLSTGEGEIDDSPAPSLSDPIGFMVSQYKYLLEHLPESARKQAHQQAIDALTMLVLQYERQAQRDLKTEDKQ